MTKTKDIVKGFKTPESRWARLGPYYAMFPLDFAFEVVEKYSKEGDRIIDPFAGRGSSIYAGSVLGRQSSGIEINPVGWLYGTVKLRPACKESTLNRLQEIYRKRNYFKRAIESIPEFYRMCYCDEVLKFLLAARKDLDWKNQKIDATLMSFLLVHLHGKLGEGLSNQMRMTKAMGPQYSLNWWKTHKMTKPPQINPFEFIKKRIEWRYKKGIPHQTESHVILGDSTLELEKMVQNLPKSRNQFSLLFTSPPYCSVTDYHTDQWLRLWLLGGSLLPKSSQERYKGRFVSKENYYNLLDKVFRNCAVLMAEDSTVYVRTDTRAFTFNSTLEILKKYFPDHTVEIVKKPCGETQTQMLGNTTNSPGEIDIILTKNAKSIEVVC